MLGFKINVYSFYLYVHVIPGCCRVIVEVLDLIFHLVIVDEELSSHISFQFWKLASLVYECAV